MEQRLKPKWMKSLHISSCYDGQTKYKLLMQTYVLYQLCTMAIQLLKVGSALPMLGLAVVADADVVAH